MLWNKSATKVVLCVLIFCSHTRPLCGVVWCAMHCNKICCFAFCRHRCCVSKTSAYQRPLLPYTDNASVTDDQSYMPMRILSIEDAHSTNLECYICFNTTEDYLLWTKKSSSTKGYEKKMKELREWRTGEYDIWRWGDVPMGIFGSICECEPIRSAAGDENQDIGQHIACVRISILTNTKVRTNCAHCGETWRMQVHLRAYAEKTGTERNEVWRWVDIIPRQKRKRVCARYGSIEINARFMISVETGIGAASSPANIDEDLPECYLNVQVRIYDRHTRRLVSPFDNLFLRTKSWCFYFDATGDRVTGSFVPWNVLPHISKALCHAKTFMPYEKT